MKLSPSRPAALVFHRVSVSILLPVVLGIAAMAFGEDKPKPVAKVDYSIPLILPAGEKSQLLLRGRGLESLTNLVAEGLSIKVLSKGKKPGPNNFPVEKVGDSELLLEVDIPKAFSSQKLQLRSEKQLLITVPIQSKPSIREKEPNQTFQTAQAVELGATISGLIDRDRDVDVYSFQGKAGQRISVEILAAELGSPADCLLTLYDANRSTLASVDDDNGKPDPKLSYQLPSDGNYFLSVIEAHDVGGPLFPYLLVIR